MKKLPAIAAILGAFLCLTGCGADAEPSASPSAPVVTNAETTTAVSGSAVTGTAEGQAVNAQTSAAQTTVQPAVQTSGQEITGSLAPDFSKITGDWLYQVQDDSDFSIYNNIGTVQISTDGSYTYTPNDGSAGRKGKIKIDYEQYSNGDEVPFYAFYDTDFWIGCYCDQNEEDVYYIGNGGMSRLVRNVDTPRQTLFDDDIPDSDASIEDIAGRWIEDGTGNILLVMQDGTFRYNDEIEGTITIHNAYNPDNSLTVWFNFYTGMSDLWYGFQREENPPQKDLYSGQDGAVHFRRAE